MKRRNIWLNLLLILVVVFLGLYIASISGYYEAKVSSEVALTKEEMESFERDVIEGKTIDINTYISKNRNDYSNSFTNAGESFSTLVINFLTKGFKGIWDYFKVLFF